MFWFVISWGGAYETIFLRCFFQRTDMHSVWTSGTSEIPGTFFLLKECLTNDKKRITTFFRSFAVPKINSEQFLFLRFKTILTE